MFLASAVPSVWDASPLPSSPQFPRHSYPSFQTLLSVTPSGRTFRAGHPNHSFLTHLSSFCISYKLTKWQGTLVLYIDPSSPLASCVSWGMLLNLSVLHSFHLAHVRSEWLTTILMLLKQCLALRRSWINIGCILNYWCVQSVFAYKLPEDRKSSSPQAQKCTGRFAHAVWLELARGLQLLCREKL